MNNSQSSDQNDRLAYRETIENYLQGEIDPAFALRARFILDKVLERRPARILDIGCGRGFYVKLLSLCDFPTDICGIDLREQHLLVARSKTAGDSRVSLQQGNIYELPFPDGHFDFVICSEVMEHLTDPAKGMSEIRRVLKVGGAVAITVPHVNFPFFWDPLNWVLMKAFNTHVHKDIHWLAGIWADHERLYDAQLMTDLFKDGYKLVTTKHVVSTCWPLSHFFIYGIGKNLVEAGLCSGLNRFNFDKPGPLKVFIASLMALPSRLLDNYEIPVDPDNSRKSVILCGLGEKI